jgi:hypothetical protein
VNKITTYVLGVDDEVSWDALKSMFSDWVCAKLDPPVIEGELFKSMSDRGTLDDVFAEFISEKLAEDAVAHRREGRYIYLGEVTADRE